MARRAVWFTSIVLTALSLGGGLAHLFAMPNKLRLTRDAYFVAQQVYRGWSWLGVLIGGAILSTLLLAIVEWRRAQTSLGAVAALACLIASQLVFWTFTFPANRATNNWTVIPANWNQLRLRWEFSHALGAFLTLAALVVLVLSLTTRPPQAEPLARPSGREQPFSS